MSYALSRTGGISLIGVDGLRLVPVAVPVGSSIEQPFIGGLDGGVAAFCWPFTNKKISGGRHILDRFIRNFVSPPATWFTSGSYY